MTDSTEWPSTCPFCGQRHDAVTSTNTDDTRFIPQDGDATICFTCGAFAIFDSSGGLRKPTKAEQRVLDRDHQTVRAAWEAIKDSIPSRQRRQ